jgi:AAA domain
MSHDKIKSATRGRMAVTGEPYAAARREVIREHQAASGHNPPLEGSTLLWINGPCGVGKTATAFELNRRLAGSVVCDPEHVGYGMRRMLPRSLWRRWQDIPAWRHSVLELLRLTLAGHDGPVIVPGTLVDLDHFQEIIGGLRGDGAWGVHHFALLAEPSTVVRRLRARSLGREPRTQPWETEVLGDWLEQLRRPEFAQHVRTDHRNVAQVADTISRSAGLAIAPSTDGPVRSWLNRYATTARSIRWG